MSGVKSFVFYTVIVLVFGCLFNIGVLCGGGSARAEEIRCSVCKKEINGHYYKYQGKCLCEKDYKASVPKCAKCGQTLSGAYYFNKDKGSYLCAKDYKASLPKCAKCGKIIEGSYYDVKGKYLCEKDYKATLPKCAKCGQTISGKYYQKEDGKYLCEKDYKASCPYCSACGKKIIAEKYFILGRDNLISCKSCEARKGPKCFLCTLPVIKNGVKYSDGRYACKYHCTGAITTQKQLNPYLSRAWKLIAAYVSPRFRVKPEYLTLHIVDEKSMKEKHEMGDMSMLFGLTRSFSRGSNMYFQIWILQGLLPEDLDSTMVHECGHVWYRLNSQDTRKGETAKEEGFCQWLSYKVNLGLGRRWQAEHIDMRDDPIYGKGFQKYKAIEKQSGIHGVIMYAKSNKP